VEGISGGGLGDCANILRFPWWVVAIRDTLQGKGVLDNMKAQIRAEIFNALDDSDEPKPELSNENLIINDLIREYLAFNDYKYSLSVFEPESGQPKEAVSREFLARKLNFVEDDRSRSVYDIFAQPWLSLILLDVVFARQALTTPLL